MSTTTASGTTASTTLTLGDVLLAGAKTFSDRLGAGLDASAESKEIKDALASAAPGLPLGAVVDGVARAVRELLDVPVTGILVGAWERARDLRTALHKTRESNGASELVPLLGHTITSEHRPSVEIMKDEVTIARLVFPMTLEFRLEGVVLRVSRGRISEILAGTIKVKATMKFGDFVIFQKAPKPIFIPDVLSLTRAEAA